MTGPCERVSQDTEKATNWTMTTNAQTASVPFCPKLLKKMVAMGWPIGLFMRPSISVPMQNARDTLIASRESTL